MGTEWHRNETNGILMGTRPTNTLSFDVYRANLNLDKGSYELEFSNVISWDSINMKMTKDELRGLADFIYKYLENK